MTELKLTVNLYPWLDLVGVIDCYDRPTIYEFKTGNRSAAKHANDFQVAVYGVLATLSDLHVERAEIHRYNQYTNKADMSVVWLTDRLLRDGINWIETFGRNVSILVEKRLYERFAASLSGCCCAPQARARIARLASQLYNQGGPPVGDRLFPSSIAFDPHLCLSGCLIDSALLIGRKR